MTRPSKRPVPPITDAEEEEIQRQIASNPDAPEATDEELKTARRFADAFPDLMESIKRSRGRPRKSSTKEAVTLRLQPETVARFKATGENWRTKMSELLDSAKVG
jgi:uncharacterized protein (DUF4415 family)